MTVCEIDFEREERQGFPEFIFGESKSLSQLVEIAGTFEQRSLPCLITRLQSDKGRELMSLFKNGKYNEEARTFILGSPSEKRVIKGHVAIVGAGTSDMSVAAEAAEVLSFLGVNSVLHMDKGVAGIHRLYNALSEIKKSRVIICIAGFEGALPSVLGGLVRQPLIAVPTSTGYGVASGGEVALRAMLSSCAAGISVVNIDNGFGAALAAYRILEGSLGDYGAENSES
ncbi:MAG: nickel pincer cofactor biosynthesis protein LarB [Oligoflexales bacterium]|nr:nickel pincer cofactor biosynthesis protein LarB [Oligoflexales bacterium]